MWPLPYRGGPGEGEGGTGQALLVAGGYTTGFTSSVVTLLPSATSWTPLSPLPSRLYGPASSMVGGRLWLVGGWMVMPPGEQRWVVVGGHVTLAPTEYFPGSPV